jgi:hypothetical protein
MSTASKYAEIRAKFFPQARPVVSAADFLEKRNRPVLHAIAVAARRDAIKTAERRGYRRGLSEAARALAVEAALKAPADGPPTMIEIAEDVARRHGLKSWKELRKHRRSRDIVFPRQEAMWRCREETEMSLPAIGRFFGGFDHTTVIHACRAYEKRNGSRALIDSAVRNV